MTIDQRAVLVLHFYLGLQLAEVAGILDIPIGTVMSRLHRGRKGLQKRLYEYAVERGLVSVEEPPFDSAVADNAEVVEHAG